MISLFLKNLPLPPGLAPVESFKRAGQILQPLRHPVAGSRLPPAQQPEA